MSAYNEGTGLSGIYQNSLIVQDQYAGIVYINGSLVVSCNAPNLWSNACNSVYVLTSNVGIGLCNPQYPLDVVGAINAAGYCNLLINSNSSSTNRAPTCYAVSNMIAAIPTPVVYSPWSNLPGANSVYLMGSNVGIGKNNPAFPLDVVGSIVTSGSIRATGFVNVGRDLSVSNALYVTGGYCNLLINSNSSSTTNAPTCFALSNLLAAHRKHQLLVSLKLYRLCHWL